MTGMSFARRFAIAATAGVLVAACASSDEPETAVTPAPFTTPVPTTDPAQVTTTGPTTTTTTSTAPVSTTTTTLPATTTTTEPLSVQELVLRGDGIGSAIFGAAPDGVIEYVSSILGGNTADTGWVDPFTFAVCEGSIARKVDWGVLTLLFTDESLFASGRRHFIGWEYGLVGQIGDQPVGLRTGGGVVLGSRVVDLLAEFPDAFVNEEEPEIGSPPNFYVSDVFWGLLTGTAGDDVVTAIFGGYGCGE